MSGHMRSSGITRRALGMGMAAAAASPATASTQQPAPIEQPLEATPRGFMRRAFALKAVAELAGDQGFGAVVVKDGRIIGEGPSRVVAASDPTAHAEMEAIRDAARRTGPKGLSGATLYSTFRPCPMCEAGASWAGIARLVHGEAMTDAGAPRLSRCG